jgi:ATP-dependent helicase/nuclease subunit A
MSISDQAEREQALDITQSFIVQAPAGSGKTELLTQRYLALLGQACQHPEEILAITFTRKAAAEMRQRIVSALEKAQQAKPEAAHAQQTWALAKQVLKRDTDANWQLLTNINRLRIQTIDSLCASLSKQLPILSQFGSQPGIAENATLLYQHAVSKLFNQLDEETPWNKAFQQLLLHLDNRVDRIESLLVKMLAKRDQWMPVLQRTKQREDRKKMIEHTLMVVNTESINHLAQHFSPELRDTLQTLIRFAAANVMANNVDSPIALGWQPELPNPFIKAQKTDRQTVEQLQLFWFAVCELLLKKDDGWRKQVSINLGFPAPSKAKDKTTKAQLKKMKDDMLAFIEACQEQRGLLESLQWFRSNPPLKYPEKDWAMVEALLELLPIAAAELTLSFQTFEQVDFIAISQSALLALGEEEKPTDLALSLDFSIQHMLIDEFQDTSITQASLLEKLTYNWQENDNKTLFLVGDPMQSIYRFRSAEVGLFLRAQQYGIGDKPLISLQLSENFRSTANVVNWVNENFSQLFPQENNIALGAISYATSHPAHALDSQAQIRCHITEDTEHEAQLAIELIKSLKGNSAVLVRARSHLDEIIKRLKQENISYQAIDIDRLAEKSITQDLLALTKALLHPADSVAWLSILRAPWCGLSLADLFRIANGRGRRTIWQQLQTSSTINSLSTDGKTRALFVIDVMQAAYHQYQRLRLADWVETTWEKLNGKQCLNSPANLIDVESYFQFLEQFNENDLSNFEAFEEQLFTQFSQTQHEHENEDTLQLLTIHKSKGLEFDNVIIPGLGRSNAPSSQQLLSWLERPREKTGEDLLIAPINTTRSSDDKIYAYIQKQEKLREYYETARLFYVATTRAKRNLHILAHADYDSDNESWRVKGNSLLKMLWPTMEASFHFQRPKMPYTPSIQLTAANIARLPIESFSSTGFQLSVDQASHHSPNDFIWQEKTAVNLGTVVHKILQTISEGEIEQWTSEKINHTLPHWKQLLFQANIAASEISSALELVKQSISNCLNDEKGRWILSSQQRAKAEFALSKQQADGITHAVLDRCFLNQDGSYWVIDYKIIKALKLDDASLEKLKKQYSAQLKHYTELLSNLTDKPVKAAIYLPLQAHLLVMAEANS